MGGIGTVALMSLWTGQELHPQSSSFLSQLLKEASLVDVWRMTFPSAKQFTWVKISDGRVSAARLDRLYVSASFTTRTANCQILPVGSTDHHLILVDLVLSPTGKPRLFWHFNFKLLHDFNFCENFKFFWANWRSKKESFPSLSQRWEVGKGQIRVFCQQYMSYSTVNIRGAVEKLESDLQTCISRKRDQAGLPHLRPIIQCGHRATFVQA